MSVTTGAGSASHTSLAVIGAGVAGCALAARLAALGWPGEVALWEMGRGPGGRASTRRSRQDPGLRIDHGSPLLNLIETQAPALIEPLLQAGWLQPFSGAVALLDARAALHFDPDELDPPFSQGLRLQGRGGMDQLCRGLLSLAEHQAVVHPGTLVRNLRRQHGGPWQLFNQEGTTLGTADWLVLAGTLPGHPRARRLFGWQEIPLQQAAREIGDPQLDAALAAIGGLSYKARSNLLLVIDPPAAAAWARLPFRLLFLDRAAQSRWGLERISIQPLEDGRCAVVVHSTSRFATAHLGLHGADSAIARMVGEPSDQEAETSLLQELESRLITCLAPWLGPDPAEFIHGARRQLMRWGAAFPQAPGLDPAFCFCRDSQVGFCGDAVAGVGFGRIEGALHSAERLAEQLMRHADPERKEGAEPAPLG